MSATEAEVDWVQVGMQAHREGRPAAPIAHPAIFAALNGRLVGDPETIRIMRAYSYGWHHANLAVRLP